MNPWETVLEHKFIDRYFENARTSPGVWSFSTPPPKISPIEGIDALEFQSNFNGAQWAQFKLSQPVMEIVGIEIEAYIYFTGDPQSASHSRVVFGIDQVLGSINTPNAIPIGHVINYDPIGLRVTMGDILPTIPLEFGKWNRIRYLWLSTGRFELHLNNSLVLFRNNIQRGQVFQFRRILIGGLPSIDRPIPALSGLIRYYHARVLTQDNIFKEVSKYSPKLDPKDLEIIKRCKDSFYKRNVTMRRRVTEFMSQFLSKETRNWQKNSKVTTPFSQRAQKAHVAALKLGDSIISNLLGKRNVRDVLDNLNIFLKYLEASNPKELKKLINDLDNIQKEFVERTRCGKAEHEMAEKYYKKFPRLRKLSERMCDIAKGTER